MDSVAELGSALAATAAFIAPGPCHAAASDSRAACPPTADSRSRAAETAQTLAIAAADLAAPGRSLAGAGQGPSVPGPAGSAHLMLSNS